MNELLAKNPRHMDTSLDHLHKELARRQHQDLLRDLRQKVSSSAVSAEVTLKKEEETETDLQETQEEAVLDAFNHHVVSKQIKSMAYGRMMRRIRHKLPLPKRLISYVVHMPLMDGISETAAKTIGRPGGIIGAGVMLACVSGALFFFGPIKNEVPSKLLIYSIFCGWAAGVFGEYLLRNWGNSRRI